MDAAVRSRHSQHTQFSLHYTSSSIVIDSYPEAIVSRTSVNIYELKYNSWKLTRDRNHSETLYDVGTVGGEVIMMVMMWYEVGY